MHYYIVLRLKACDQILQIRSDTMGSKSSDESQRNTQENFSKPCRVQVCLVITTHLRLLSQVGILLRMTSFKVTFSLEMISLASFKALESSLKIPVSK